MTTRRILTLHAPVGRSVLDGVLTSLEEALADVGAERVWIDPTSAADLTVLADFPDPAPNGQAVPAPRTADEADLRNVHGLG